jgi:hypothetical protein
MQLDKGVISSNFYGVILSPAATKELMELPIEPNSSLD